MVLFFKQSKSKKIKDKKKEEIFTRTQRYAYTATLYVHLAVPSAKWRMRNKVLEGASLESRSMRHRIAWQVEYNL